METLSTKKNKIANLTTEDRRKLTAFFELLIKVDKRINPNLYKNISIDM